MTNSNNGLSRDGAGHWIAGTSGNPAGSLAGRRNINLTATLRRKINAAARERGEPGGGDLCVGDLITNELVNMALTCPVHKVRLAAIAIIIDRLDGKATTPISVTPAEFDLTSKVRQAYQSVMQFSQSNGLKMSGWRKGGHDHPPPRAGYTQAYSRAGNEFAQVKLIIFPEDPAKPSKINSENS